MEIRRKISRIVQCMQRSVRPFARAAGWYCLLLIAMVGCGTTKSYTATEQLLLSDAVDSTITKIDFRPISNRRIFLDTKFTEGAGKSKQGDATNHLLVNADYVISAVRQQLVAAGCMLVDKREDADLVVELRTGALGSDSHSIIYGLPATNLGGASGIFAGTPAIPSIPELALAKKDLRSAAAKVALFAYDRQTLDPVWQSGIAQAGSNARDSFFMGVGPFQSGTIYAAPRFAGRRIVRSLYFWQPKPTAAPIQIVDPINGVDHRSTYVFQAPQMPATNGLEPPPEVRVSDGTPTPTIQR
jgi:hypothetical protein